MWIAIVVFCIFCVVFISLYLPVIFQRGNPIPYLVASKKLDNNMPYVQVEQTDFESVYISKRGICNELFQLFIESTGAKFQEQLGNTYIFSDGETKWMIKSEVYWKDYTVWEIPIFK